VVNDGSKDTTLKVAKEYYEKYPDIFRLVSLRKNHGKGAAMKVGVAEALGKYILMVRFFPLSQFLLLI
jgi:glycosyltransferase involved in cell wall biosynthesis